MPFTIYVRYMKVYMGCAYLDFIFLLWYFFLELELYIGVLACIYGKRGFVLFTSYFVFQSFPLLS